MAPCDLTSWPTPKALDGVKSKKRPVFKVEAAEVRSSSGRISRISGLSLGLESRIAVVGEAGRATASLLLREQEPVSGAAWRQEGLVVAHLGAHLAGPAADAQRHLVAAAAEMQRQRPHVVVLEEALAAGGAAWAEAFAALLRSEALCTFRGAVAVCCAEETFAVRRACAERWAQVADQVRQEEVTGRSLEILEDVLGGSAWQQGGAAAAARAAAPKRRGRQGAEAETEALVEDARLLSEFCFEEDLIQYAGKEGWIVTLLVEATPDGTRGLRGYLCHRLLPPPRAELHIERLAVPQKLRGRGYARQLMRWVLDEAARLPPEQCASLTCSAFDKVAPFYGNFGFAPSPCPQPHGEDEEDPQTWMELRNVSLLSHVATL